MLRRKTGKGGGEHWYGVVTVNRVVRESIMKKVICECKVL